MKRIVLFLALLSATAVEAQIKQITGGGYQNSNGSACAGCILYLQLPVDATVTGTGQIVPNVNSYTLDANGNVPANSNLWANDQLTPTGLTYKATLTLAGGGRIWGPEFLSIAGVSPISLTQLVPVASSSVFFGNPAILTVANTFTALQTFTGGITSTGAITATAGANNITSFLGGCSNAVRCIDGVKYPATGAGFQQAVTDCNNDVTCSGVDTGLMGNVTTTTTTSIGNGKFLLLRMSSSISGTSDPVVCFNQSDTIMGEAYDLVNTTASTIKSTSTTSRVLAPCTPSATTVGLLLKFVALVNTAASSTAAILDMTNTQDAKLFNPIVNRASTCGAGTVANVLVKQTSTLTAYFDEVNLITIQGCGEAFDFESSGSVSGPNAFHVFGGVANASTDCIAINLGGAGNSQVNEINFSNFTCEAYTGKAFNIQGPAVSINFKAGRLEASNPATLFSIANLASISGISIDNPTVFGTQTFGTDNNKSVWANYTNGGPPGPVNYFQALSVGTTWAQVYGASGGQQLIQLSTTGDANPRLALGSSGTVLTGNGTTAPGVWMTPGTNGSAVVSGFTQHTGTLQIGNNGTFNVTNLLTSPIAPTIAAAGCGGGAASIVVSNGTAAFKVNVGTTPTSACTLTFPSATTGWNVFCTDITTNSTSVFLQKQTGAESQTSVTITNFNDVAVATAFVASDILKCTAAAD